MPDVNDKQQRSETVEPDAAILRYLEAPAYAE
jgi:hypothetical protein